MSNVLRMTQAEYDARVAKYNAHVAKVRSESGPAANAAASDFCQKLKQAAKQKPQNADVDLLCWQLNNVGLPHEREHRFDDRRKWRFDIAFPAVKLAIEIDGGLFIDGGHSRGRARINDMERDIAANLLGWLVVRMPPEWVKPGKALAHIEQLVKVRP